MNMSFYVCTILYQYLIYYDIIWWTYDGYHIILPGIDRCLPSMARHIPFRPHGVTDLSHSRRRPAPVDSCLDEVFRDAIGGQMLMDFLQIGKNDVGWCRKSSSWLNIQKHKMFNNLIRLDTIGGFCWGEKWETGSQEAQVWTSAFCDFLGHGFWKGNHIVIGEIPNDLS